MNDHLYQDVFPDKSDELTPLQTSVAGRLSGDETADLPDGWYEQGRDAVLPLICKWILEQRIDGKTDTSITRHLVKALELSKEESDLIMAMARVSGAAAADVEDLKLDPDAAVDRLVQENDVSEPLATDLVNMGLNLFHDALDEAMAHEDFEMGVEESAAEAYVAAAEYVIDCFEAGRGKKEIVHRLVEKNIFAENAAPGFVDDVVLAEIAATRVNEGEDGTDVFEELSLQDRSPYIVMLALHLIETGNK